MMKKFILPVFLGLISFTSYATGFKDFTETCTDFVIDKASVSAVCRAENGARYHTALRLRGINNYRGVLIVEADSSVMSKFHTTCKQMAIDSNGVLAGTCKNSANAYVWTSLDLRPILRNYNGSLVYPLTTY